MIKVHFYNYGCGVLHIEKELGITEDVDNFLINKIPELQLEATDSLYDLYDNEIFWFSAENEVQCVDKINYVLKSYISSQSQMQYSVTITSDLT